MATPWKSRYAQRNQRMGRSIIRELLKFTQQPISSRLPAGCLRRSCSRLEESSEAACRVLSEHGAQALQYGPTEGFPLLRQFICERMNRYGIKVEPANVFITTGSQQALDLIGKLLINPGDRVLVEEPTYLGALQAWNAYQAEYVGGAHGRSRAVHRLAGRRAAGRAEVHVHPAEFPEPRRHDAVAGAPPRPGAAVQQVRHPARRR